MRKNFVQLSMLFSNTEYIWPNFCCEGKEINEQFSGKAHNKCVTYITILFFLGISVHFHISLVTLWLEPLSLSLKCGKKEWKKRVKPTRDPRLSKLTVSTSTAVALVVPLTITGVVVASVPTAISATSIIVTVVGVATCKCNVRCFKHCTPSLPCHFNKLLSSDYLHSFRNLRRNFRHSHLDCSNHPGHVCRVPLDLDPLYHQGLHVLRQLLDLLFLHRPEIESLEISNNATMVAMYWK